MNFDNFSITLNLRILVILYDTLFTILLSPRTLPYQCKGVSVGLELQKLGDGSVDIYGNTCFMFDYVLTLIWKDSTQLMHAQNFSKN